MYQQILNFFTVRDSQWGNDNALCLKTINSILKIFMIQVAQDRCTSTYMPDRVVPMLPRRLCEDLCSLNPSVERFSFSVVFEMTPKAEIVGEPWYGRGIIKSCTKFAYENAQKFIEHPTGPIDQSAFPEVTDGWNLENVRECVLDLNMIAKQLRKKRVDNGSVRIEQTKIGFTWDEETKKPNGYFPHIRVDAHKMIEEYMLLANIAVAQKIESTFPELAFLRRHGCPDDEKMEKLEEQLKEMMTIFNIYPITIVNEVGDTILFV